MTQIYTKSHRYDKRIITPRSTPCPKCSRLMLPLNAQTTLNYKKLRFSVPIKYCSACKIVKLLEKMEIIA